MCGAYFILYSVQCTVYTVHCILYIVQYTDNNVLYTVYNVHYSMHNVQLPIIFYIVYCTLIHTLYSIQQCVQQCTPYTVHCTVYTIHCMVNNIHHYTSANLQQTSQESSWSILIISHFQPSHVHVTCIVPPSTHRRQPRQSDRSNN